ncbi:MAG: hypothetical protein ACRC3H_09640 [Lachnospiraceae bacterium]
MDFEKLVDQITKEVFRKIENSECMRREERQNPRLLVACCGQSDRSVSLMEDEGLRERFNLECIDFNNCNNCDTASFEILVLCDLNYTDLSEIAQGIGSRGCTCLAVEAILSGKRIYVAKEGVSLFKYKDCAPEPYYNMMLDKLNMLADCGVKFLNGSQLSTEIIKDHKGDHIEPQPLKKDFDVSGQLVLDNKVVTETDITLACVNRISSLIVGERTIITDLAREKAKSKGICITRRDYPPSEAML